MAHNALGRRSLRVTRCAASSSGGAFFIAVSPLHRLVPPEAVQFVTRRVYANNCATRCACGLIIDNMPSYAGVLLCS